jgi:hypothetical protein
VLEVFDDEIFAITPADELIHLSLLDGTTTVEATSVRELDVSTDRRWLLWQDNVPVDADSEWPSGANYLRDRSSGATHRLEDAPLAGANPDSLAFADAGVLRLQLGYLYEEPERLYRLPSLESFDLPLGVITHFPLPDSRLFVGDAFSRGNFAIVDPTSGTATEVFDDLASVRLLEDHLEFLENVYCCIEQDRRAQGPVWFVDFDGTAELLADAATYSYQFLSDDRLLTTLDVGRKWTGDLVVVDADDLVERVLDDHVPLIGVTLEDGDEIVYGVSDGERTGVWLTRPATPRQ